MLAMNSSAGTAPSRGLPSIGTWSYRFFLEQKNFAPSTINVRLAAVRRLAYEASDTGLLSPELAAGIRRVKGAKRPKSPPVRFSVVKSAGQVPATPRFRRPSVTWAASRNTVTRSTTTSVCRTFEGRCPTTGLGDRSRRIATLRDKSEAALGGRLGRCGQAADGGDRRSHHDHCNNGCARNSCAAFFHVGNAYLFSTRWNHSKGGRVSCSTR
jgi:hypothetical protein